MHRSKYTPAEILSFPTVSVFLFGLLLLCLPLLFLPQTLTDGTCLRFLMEQICHIPLAVMHDHRIFYCPYDIHELVTDADMSVILRELNEDHKLLLFLSALRQYSSVKIAAIRGQSDRNIRKVRNTMLKKIRKKLLAALAEKVQAQQPLTLLEKEFLTENSVDIENNSKT